MTDHLVLVSEARLRSLLELEQRYIPLSDLLKLYEDFVDCLCDYSTGISVLSEEKIQEKLRTIAERKASVKS